MSIDYYNKYIKYKTKYSLLKQLGSAKEKKSASKKKGVIKKVEERKERIKRLKVFIDCDSLFRKKSEEMYTFFSHGKRKNDTRIRIFSDNVYITFTNYGTVLTENIAVLFRNALKDRSFTDNFKSFFTKEKFNIKELEREMFIVGCIMTLNSFLPNIYAVYKSMANTLPSEDDLKLLSDEALQKACVDAVDKLGDNFLRLCRIYLPDYIKLILKDLLYNNKLYQILQDIYMVGHKQLIPIIPIVKISSFNGEVTNDNFDSFIYEEQTIIPNILSKDNCDFIRNFLNIYYDKNEFPFKLKIYVKGSTMPEYLCSFTDASVLAYINPRMDIIKNMMSPMIKFGLQPSKTANYLVKFNKYQLDLSKVHSKLHDKLLEGVMYPKKELMERMIMENAHISITNMFDYLHFSGIKNNFIFILCCSKFFDDLPVPQLYRNLSFGVPEITNNCLALENGSTEYFSTETIRIIPEATKYEPLMSELYDYDEEEKYKDDEDIDI